VPVTVTANDEAVRMSSSALTVTVRRRPWQLSVSGPDGRQVYRQEIYDRALRQPVSLPIGYSRSRDGSTELAEVGETWCHETFALAVDESIFGLGQHFGAANRRGQRLISWNREASGLNTGPLTYINVPFFMSSRGYGVFVNHAGRIVYEMGQPSTVAGSFQVDDPYLDYFLIYGPGPKEILARYDDLTGHPPLPPLWSFGVWMSRCMYRDRPQVEEVVERMRELGIPLDVVHLDPLWLKHRRAHTLDGCDFVWDEEAFPDPAGVIRWLAERGVKLSLWENP
jgi:alpha-D-xyloside xylohydrolase